MASDLAKLPTLCEQTIVEQLEQRFRENQIYVSCKCCITLPLSNYYCLFTTKNHNNDIILFQTYVADILISLNPYSKLDIYHETTSADYSAIPGLASREPHIFALADVAYQSLKRTG